MPGEHRRRVSRRSVLGALAVAASLAGCPALSPGDDASTTDLAADEARTLATRFAPALYFDEHERWFPTDPRPYATERDGERIVDGFDAVDGYAERSDEAGGPPMPRVFYHAVRYDDSPLAVVQFWFYAAFDQFTTNFHWHDWEVLHVFVDLETDEPQLYVASSHSRRVPNNEFLDPDPAGVPRVLSELGSHSSALSVNDVHDRFQRLPTDGTFADITNSAIEGIQDLEELPLAYGLPRDEGTRLPYLVPELDGAPLYEHERLPSVSRTHLVPQELTVRSLSGLASPPGDLPARALGVTFRHEDRDTPADVTYDLVPTADLEDIVDFTGPRLSFEFAIPSFAEDAVAGHITSTGVPWTQDRYENPAADISDPHHRATLSDRYDAVGEPAPVNAVVAGVTQAVTADDAPDGAGLETIDVPVEAVALLESDPAAVPTFRGVVVTRGVDEGDHRLTVNGAGLAPHAETVTVADGGPTVAGVDGEIPLVARERAVKLEVDAGRTDADLRRLAVDDDFAGRLYDAPLSGPDAVYVHAGGAFTAEVEDASDELGAFRVRPDPDAGGETARIDAPRTGTASLAAFVADVAAETSSEVAATDGGGNSSAGAGGGDRGTATPTGSAGGSQNAVRGLARALEAVAESAERAARRAEAGDRAGATSNLEAVSTRLDRAADRLAAARQDLPPPIARATERRHAQARTRTRQARDAERL